MNFFEDRTSEFLNKRGYTGNKAAEEMFSGAFAAANESGKSFANQYDFSSGNQSDYNQGLSLAQDMGYTDFLNDFKKQDDFVNPFGGDMSVFDSAVNPGDFFSQPTNFFNIDNAPNKEAFDNVMNNTFTSRMATEADVANGLAQNVGDVIEEINPPAEYEALQAQYFEELKNKVDDLSMKEGASKDYYDALSELSGLLNAAQSGSVENYNNELLDNVSVYNAGMTAAIENLANTRAQNAVNEYRAIDDALRANTLGAMRAGEFGTRGASNRMLVDAAMRAAQDRQNVIGDINLRKAEDLYGLESEVQNEKKAIYDRLASQRKQLRDAFATRANSFGQEFQTRLKALRDEFATFIGSTPDEVDPIMQLASEYVALMAEKGEIDTLNAQEQYEAFEKVVNLIAEQPNTMLQLLQSQIADELGEITLGEENYRNLMSGKLNNIGSTIEMIEGLSTMDPEREKFIKQLNALQDMFATSQGTLGTNPLPSGQVAVPSFDAGEATQALQRIAEGTGTESDISAIRSVIDVAGDVADLFKDLSNLGKSEESTTTSDETGTSTPT
mgnify:CR=1 FL=1|tara:strand:- start:2402 stop:4072 length:1671 start_codon:yes stop_codon:yes gene_type:complete